MKIDLTCCLHAGCIYWLRWKPGAWAC